MTVYELKEILRADYEPDWRLQDIIDRGKSKIDTLTGVTNDYDSDREAESLLIAYCRYEYNNALEDFEQNFSMQINALAIRSAIQEMNDEA